MTGRSTHRWVASVTSTGPAVFTVQCGGHAQFTGHTYEQVEDAWRAHVHAETGTAPAPMGDTTITRWTP